MVPPEDAITYGRVASLRRRALGRVMRLGAVCLALAGCGGSSMSTPSDAGPDAAPSSSCRLGETTTLATADRGSYGSLSMQPTQGGYLLSARLSGASSESVIFVLDEAGNVRSETHAAPEVQHATVAISDAEFGRVYYDTVDESCFYRDVTTDGELSSPQSIPLTGMVCGASAWVLSGSSWLVAGTSEGRSGPAPVFGLVGEADELLRTERISASYLVDAAPIVGGFAISTAGRDTGVWKVAADEPLSAISRSGALLGNQGTLWRIGWLSRSESIAAIDDESNAILAARFPGTTHSADAADGQMAAAVSQPRDESQNHLYVFSVEGGAVASLHVAQWSAPSEPLEQSVAIVHGARRALVVWSEGGALRANRLTHCP